MSNYIGVFKGLSESLEQAKKSICCLIIFTYYKKKAISSLQSQGKLLFHQFYFQKNIQIEQFLKELLGDIFNAYTVNLRCSIDGYFTFKDMTENLQKKIPVFQKPVSKGNFKVFCNILQFVSSYLSHETLLVKFGSLRDFFLKDSSPFDLILSIIVTFSFVN